MNIQQQLRLEFIKTRTRTFTTFFVLYSLVQALLIFGSYSVRMGHATGTQLPEDGLPITSSVFENLMIYFNNLSVIPIFVLCLYVMNDLTKESANGVFKKHIIDGMSHLEILTAKILIYVFICVLSVIVMFLLLGLLGFVFRKKST